MSDGKTSAAARGRTYACGVASAPTSLSLAPVALASPLRCLDSVEVGAAARAETRNREVYLPPVGIYRWWARRTGAVNRAIVAAAAAGGEASLLVADPFAGGGVIPLAAILEGHRVYAQDLNPWATQGLSGMLGMPDPELIRAAAAELAARIEPTLQRAYGTRLADGRPADLSQTIRVASACCRSCRRRIKLFPHALVSLKQRRETRRPEAFLACPGGHLFEGIDGQHQRCPTCSRTTDPAANYTTGRVVGCVHCGQENRLGELARRGWRWDAVLVERAAGAERELDRPTSREKEMSRDGEWAPSTQLPEIPSGQETSVLLRHGFRAWHDLYPARQRVVIERLLAYAPEVSSDPQVVQALRLGIIGSIEMAGYLSRWDRFYLKSYEAMAGHRFNFSTLVAEPNVWGASQMRGRGTVRRRLERMSSIAEWLHGELGRTLTVSGPREVSAISHGVPSADVTVIEGSSERMALPDAALDLIVTDPPYHDDVEYDELSLPFRAWSQLSLARLTESATANTSVKHNTDIGDYEELLTRIFAECRRVLRSDGHMIFSYANRRPEAWIAVFGALDAAGLQACGVTYVHAENETDISKRGVRACTHDLLLDVVRSDVSARRWRPTSFPPGDEGEFLSLLADGFLKVGRLRSGWRSPLSAALNRLSFLR